MVLDNQTSINVTFRPTENKAYSGGSVTTDDYIFYPDDGISDLIQGAAFGVTGQGFLETFDYISNGYERWDLISYLLYGYSNQLLKLWQSNKHLSEENKRKFAPTPGTPLFLEPLTDEEVQENIETDTSLLPPWKR